MIATPSVSSASEFLLRDTRSETTSSILEVPRSDSVERFAAMCNQIAFPSLLYDEIIGYCPCRWVTLSTNPGAKKTAGAAVCILEAPVTALTPIMASDGRCQPLGIDLGPRTTTTAFTTRTMGLLFFICKEKFLCSCPIQYNEYKKCARFLRLPPTSTSSAPG